MDSIEKDRQSVEGMRREIDEEIRSVTPSDVLQRDRIRDAAHGDGRHDEA